MTFARTVRLPLLLVVFALLSVWMDGPSVWRSSLAAQSRMDIRQYEPATDSLTVDQDAGDWDEIPAYVSTVDGDAKLDRDGETTTDFEQVPLLTGDQLRTTRGRVEVLYSDGSVVALDEYSVATVAADSTWRLHTGRMKVTSRNTQFIVDAAPVGVSRLRSGGDYRVTVAVNRRGDPEVELAVTRGSGDLENPLGRTLVRPGTRALTTEAYAPSIPYAFAAPRDEFERWTESLDAERYGAESGRYLPVELRAYGGAFDRYGYWGRHSTYGWVWYPRVAVGWEPFHSGRWSFVVGFGYNWIGGYRWEWPTHYYGRWDRYGSSWFWVPSRAVGPRRVGYATPRRSFNVSVPYYSRPSHARPSSGRPIGTDAPYGPGARIGQRDNGRPGDGVRNTTPSIQPRVAVPRSMPASRDPRPSAAPAGRPTDDPAFWPRSSQGENTRTTRQPRESSPPNRPAVTSHERRPSAQPSTSGRPPQSVQPPTRPSRPESRTTPTVGRLPDPQRSGARQPSGGRTPSASSSRSPSGSAVRRGGGKR